MTETLFLNNDPRYLAGGKIGKKLGTVDYAYQPKTIDQGHDATLSPEYVAKRSVDLSGQENSDMQSALRAAVSEKQELHYGKNAYHHRPSTNVFILKDDPCPTAGVELETIRHNSVDDSSLCNDLSSNWFHFERDGSLGDNGYECITEPLPACRYRDIRLWLGLQNALAPWTESWKHSCTGLHVHVGVNRFYERTARSDKVTGCPVSLTAESAANLAKHLVSMLYYTLVPENLKKAVFMRDNTNFCGNNFEYKTSMRVQSVLQTRPRSDALVNFAIADNLASNKDTYNVMRYPVQPGGRLVLENRQYNLVETKPRGMTGHGAELNMDHNWTIEFRRGKGTLNGVTIHRMVEFTTLLVRFVENIMFSAPFDVSQEALYQFIYENTTSDALKTLVAQKKEMQDVHHN